MVLLLLIFVFYNLKSKIFLGDNGIFILGFIISILYLKTYNIYGNISFDHLILISFLPLIDMIRVSVFRIFNGKNPMRPDMTHIHHIITNAEGKLIKIIILTISPIIIYYFTNNFLLTSSLLLILYFYIILNKKKMKYCKNCLEVDTRPRTKFNKEGLCSACTYKKKQSNLSDKKNRIT